MVVGACFDADCYSRPLPNSTQSPRTLSGYDWKPQDTTRHHRTLWITTKKCWKQKTTISFL